MKSHSQTLPSAPAADIYRPSRFRFFSFRILMMFAAYQAGFTIFQILSKELQGVTYPREAWLASSIAFMLVFSISLFVSNRRLTEEYAIQITGDKIEGPSGFPRRRVQFDCVCLDYPRCQRMSLLNWLFQFRYLWSIDGQKIVLLLFAYAPNDLDAMYEKLGLAAKN